ncbi:hypothetical protein Arad_8138 [Rhizobium rhizogenes K84]|uniref:Uncharacterized protein n=1 Tax=Rhizobium rhizogenes (strain K84 / ATCC BAA-868) TaxID=311403 RepID=B9JHT7_RHIR8|nr:hypothetical protein Arad_8138 [Rhizobium rhizogenes K84]
MPLFAIGTASHELCIRHGERHTESADLPRRLGRLSTPLAEVVDATLKRNADYEADPI